MITEVETVEVDSSTTFIHPDFFINAPFSNFLKLDPFDLVSQAKPEELIDFINFFLEQVEQASFVRPDKDPNSENDDDDDEQFSWELFRSYIMRMMFRLFTEIDFLAHLPLSSGTTDISVTYASPTGELQLTKTINYDHQISKLATCLEVKKALAWSLYRNVIDFKPSLFKVYTESSLTDLNKFIDFIPSTLRVGYEEYIGLATASYYNPTLVLEDPRKASPQTKDSE